jgi:hypothetical protein
MTCSPTVLSAGKWSFPPSQKLQILAAFAVCGSNLAVGRPESRALLRMKAVAPRRLGASSSLTALAVGLVAGHAGLLPGTAASTRAITSAAAATSATPAIRSAHGHQNEVASAMTVSVSTAASGLLTANDGGLPSGAISWAS